VRTTPSPEPDEKDTLTLPGATFAPAWRSVMAALRRARRAQVRRDQGRTPLGRVLTAAVCVLAGLMVMASALNARGTDLRPGRNTDLVSLVQAQSRRNTALARQVTTLRQEVDALSTTAAGPDNRGPDLSTPAKSAGLTAVAGPAVSVTLDDAPSSVAADGVDPDLLVVHQQDIQAVVNALWSGGAEAMTIQGQRVISTTGVKCVGNTVVLHGIPYAPPYVISAIGNQSRLQRALTDAPPIQVYKQYVDAYRLVYRERLDARLTFPAHQGSMDLEYASPLQDTSSPSGDASPDEKTAPTPGGTPR
jgi:uncharacterized protein YlxW (UPF0749 family)